MTRSLDNPREGENAPALREDESCDVGVIGVTRDVDGQKMDSAVCEEYPLVPRFEGEEDNQCETTDLLVAECHPSQIEFPVVEVHRTFKSMFDRVTEVPTSVLNPAEGSAKFLQGLETCYDASATHILRFELFSVGGTYERGQRGVIDLEKGGGLTIIDTVHLERPPGNVFVFVEPPTVKILNLGDFAPEMSHEKAEE